MSAEDSQPDAETHAGALPSSDHSTAALDHSGPHTEYPIALDNYRIVRQIGEGGMGMVYAAEQQSPRRLVALKIIRGGPLAGERAEKLFQREIQALARLRHPGIAAIYESGRTLTGQYFFSMELAAGETLDVYLHNHAAETGSGRDALRARLELFLRIAAAVNYAHQHGVIHRDLKPSNILVSDKEEFSQSYTSFDDRTEVKVLDFGLARITEPDSEGYTALTQAGRLEGTLAYMSPEQVRGTPDEVDLRTDIYSLGIILYWAICGRLPYNVQKIPLVQASRIICDDPPQPMTTTLTRSGKVDPDLKTVILTAVEKDPARRYQSVAAMAEDVCRYLADQPIVARAPSTVYHITKLVTRHRVGAAFSLALLVILIVSGISMVVQARRIRRQAETTRHVSQFLVDIFKGNDPDQARGRSLTVRDVLENGGKRISAELKTQPEVQSQLQFTVGSVYKSLGSYLEAKSQLEASLATRRRIFGENSVEVADVYDELGDTLRNMAKFPEARAAAERAVAIRRDRLGNNNEFTALAINNLALTLENSNDFDKSEKLYREALNILERAKGAGSVEISTVLNNYSILNRRRGDLARAESLTRRALDIRRKAYPDGHPWLANSLQQLGRILSDRGDYRQAESLTREALAMREKLFGADSEEAMKSRGELASVLADQGENQQAAALYERKLEADRKLLGEDHPVVAIDLNNLASVREELSRYAEAEAMYRHSLAIRTKVFGENSPQVARVLNNLARVVGKEGRTPEAERLFQQSLDVKFRTQGESHPDTADTKVNLARLYLAGGKLQEAEGLLRSGVNDLLTKTPTSRRTALALLTRAEYYRKTDRPNDADQDYRKAIGILKASLPSGHKRIVEAEQQYADFRSSAKH